jgi:hypothetical protein
MARTSKKPSPELLRAEEQTRELNDGIETGENLSISPRARRPYRSPQCTLDEVEQALRESGGIMSLAAKRLGITRWGVQDWVKRYPQLREMLNEFRGTITDIAANNIVTAVRSGDKLSSMFWLKTQAKDEGWTQRTEYVGEGGGPMVVRREVDLRDVPDDDLNSVGRAIRDAIERDAARRSAVELQQEQAGEEPVPVPSRVVPSSRPR